MTSRNADAGKGFEREVMHYLNRAANRPICYKPANPAWEDVGDLIASIVTIQCKRRDRVPRQLLSDLDAAADQAARFGGISSAAVIHRPGAPLGMAIAAMPLSTFAYLLHLADSRLEMEDME